jgi:8-oxo-dGTP diphosphatase
MPQLKASIALGVLVLLKKENKVFLIERANTGWCDGLWGIPGGKLDGQETLRQAAAREAHEEIGVVIQPEHLQLLHVSHLRWEPGKELIMFTFMPSEWQSEPYNKEPHLHSNASWLDLNNLPTNIIPNALEVIDAYQKGILYGEYGW